MKSPQNKQHLWWCELLFTAAMNGNALSGVQHTPTSTSQSCCTFWKKCHSSRDITVTGLQPWHVCYLLKQYLVANSNFTASRKITVMHTQLRSSPMCLTFYCQPFKLSSLQRLKVNTVNLFFELYNIKQQIQTDIIVPAWTVLVY